MRTLFEITEAAKGQGIDAVTKEELYFAFLAEDSLGAFSFQVIMGLASKDLGAQKWYRQSQWEEEFGRRKRAGEADPQVWMGKNVPGNPSYDSFRKVALKIMDKAMKGELPNQQGDRNGSP